MWFSEYFSKKGFQVTGFDNTNPVSKNIKKAESLISAILNVDYVLLSTPTKKTPEIIRLIAKEMKRESFLIDITSQIENDIITINLKDAGSPALVKDLSDKNTFHVVMPMKIWFILFKANIKYFFFFSSSNHLIPTTI